MELYSVQTVVCFFTRLTSLSVLPLPRTDGPRPAGSPGLFDPPFNHQVVSRQPWWKHSPAGQQPEPRGEELSVSDQTFSDD